jgi:SpoVK/Ycf46/Vps4 family AAA+-type ATPase
MCLFYQVNEAAMAALEERLDFFEHGTSSMSSSCLIELSHFERALSKVKPSVSEQVSANADSAGSMHYLRSFHPFDIFILDCR